MNSDAFLAKVNEATNSEFVEWEEVIRAINTLRLEVAELGRTLDICGSTADKLHRERTELCEALRGAYEILAKYESFSLDEILNRGGKIRQLLHQIAEDAK